MDDLVEIGVFGAEDEEEPIWLRKERFTGRPRTFRIVLDERPVRRGIDPLHKLIDRDLDDNVVDVERRTGTPVRARRPASNGARPAAGVRRGGIQRVRWPRAIRGTDPGFG